MPRSAMWDSLLAFPGVLIPIFAIVIVIILVGYWAMQDGDASEQGRGVVEQRPPAAQRVAPAPDREHETLRRRPWSENRTHEDPDWIRQRFDYLDRQVQYLRDEVNRLTVEAQRPKESAPVGSEILPAPAPAAPPANPPPRRAQPVDLRDGLVVPSRSLAATGSLVVSGGDAAALLYLNESIEIDHLSKERWSQYFDFGNGDAYRRYRTVEPSRIDWNAATEQGRLLERGKVEAA